MDLSVRASLQGWKFVYIKDVELKSKLPSTFKSYRSQQHRWSCGPANLFRKMVVEIARKKEVSIWTKVYMIYNFFFIRKIEGTTFAFSFYVIVLPLTSLFPEVDIPKWGAILANFTIAMINTIVATPRSIHLAVPWVLFENLMSFHRTKAVFIGMFEAKRANEWVVTEKLGDGLKNKSTESTTPKGPARVQFFRERLILGQEPGNRSVSFCLRMLWRLLWTRPLLHIPLSSILHLYSCRIWPFWQGCPKLLTNQQHNHA